MTKNNYQKHFTRQIYLIDTKFNYDPSKETIPRPVHTLEEYAAEAGYEISLNVIEANLKFTKDWGVQILMDNTPESLQLAYRLVTYLPKGSTISPLITNKLKDIKWYNTESRASDSIVVLTNAPTLNMMGNQILGWKFYSQKDEILVDDNHNYHFIITSPTIDEKILKFSGFNERRIKYNTLQQKLTFERN